MSEGVFSDPDRGPKPENLEFGGQDRPDPVAPPAPPPEDHQTQEMYAVRCPKGFIGFVPSLAAARWLADAADGTVDDQKYVVNSRPKRLRMSGELTVS